MTTSTNTDLTRSELDAAVVRRGYAAFNAADIDVLMQVLHENASWHTPGRSPIAGLRQGRTEVLGHFGVYGGDTNGTFKAAVQSVMADGEGKVVGIHRNTAERNGKQLDVDCCIVFEVRDGRVMSGAEHFFDLDAWDEFWK